MEGSYIEKIKFTDTSSSLFTTLAKSSFAAVAKQGVALLDVVKHMLYFALFCFILQDKQSSCWINILDLL